MRAAVILFAIIMAFTIRAEASGSGQFLPIGGDGSPFEQVHFVPKNGNKVFISCNEEKIPPGVGVVSGGVIGNVTDASVDKTLHQTLIPNTLYRTFVYMREGVMTMDFSTGRHREDPVCGVQVHENDPARTLVGMVFTDEKGMVHGESGRQLTISWFNRGATGLGAWVGYWGAPMVTSCSATPEPVGPIIEWLSFGINNEFQQAFTMPNLHASGTVVNDTVGGAVHLQLAVFPDDAYSGWGGQWNISGDIGGYYQSEPSDAGVVSVVMIGGGSAKEGRVRGRIVLSNGGTKGCATMTRGTIYLDPLES